MALIYQTSNFIIKSAEHPNVYIDRKEGGHIQVVPKASVADRTKLSAKLAIEYMKLSMVAGEAMKTTMVKRGVNIGLINYQDMGNWQVFQPQGTTMHLHIFGRAIDAIVQKYGDAVYLPHLESGYYQNFQSLDADDVVMLSKEIDRLMRTQKYSF